MEEIDRYVGSPIIRKQTSRGPVHGLLIRGVDSGFGLL